MKLSGSGWRAVVNTVMNLPVTYICWVFLDQLKYEVSCVLLRETFCVPDVQMNISMTSALFTKNIHHIPYVTAASLSRLECDVFCF